MNGNIVVFVIRKDGRKEGRKEHIYLTIRQCTIHIYNNVIVRRLSLRLDKAARATTTEIIITYHRIVIIVGA